MGIFVPWQLKPNDESFYLLQLYVAFCSQQIIPKLLHSLSEWNLLGHVQSYWPNPEAVVTLHRQWDASSKHPYKSAFYFPFWPNLNFWQNVYLKLSNLL